MKTEESDETEGVVNILELTTSGYTVLPFRSNLLIDAPLIGLYVVSAVYIIFGLSAAIPPRKPPPNDLTNELKFTLAEDESFPPSLSVITSLTLLVP